MHTELGSHAIPIVRSVQRANTFFSHVPTLEACLLLGHCFSLQEHATDAGSLAQKQCSRGGWKEHGSHLDGGRKKAAGRVALEKGGLHLGTDRKAVVIETINPFLSYARLWEEGGKRRIASAKLGRENCLF